MKGRQLPAPYWLYWLTGWLRSPWLAGHAHPPAACPACRCRVSTTGLLALLCALWPRYMLPCVCLIALDIFSHWFQMYASLLSGASTHKVRSVCTHVQPRHRQAAEDGMPCVARHRGLLALLPALWTCT